MVNVMNPIMHQSVSLRDPAKVMRLSRLGSFHQSRLSFMRIFTRRLQRQRSDRVIATAWDATFALYDGVPDDKAIQRLSENVPLQEVGRLEATELTLSRANRSVRLWHYVVKCLAAGKQPEREQLQSVGYLMRTTAVYGSGKFGAADREKICQREEFSEPFQAEMMSVYLIRQFVRDLVNHMAAQQAADTAVALDDDLARLLGIGNSTGLGMAPFIINHPQLFNNWIMAREEALRRVRCVPQVQPQARQLFETLLASTQRLVSNWYSQHPIQADKIDGLSRDLDTLAVYISDHRLWKEQQPWNTLFEWAEQALATEAQECLVSLLLEPYPEQVDELASALSAQRTHAVPLDGRMCVDQLTDWSERAHIARAWYVSEEKLEPRLGERFEEEIADYEQPLAPARDAAALFACIENMDADISVAQLLLEHPQHRESVKRLQLLQRAPYAEIYDNTISAELIPFDLLRCKLSFFGATHFDPRSDRWLRISLYANAPYPHELAQRDADRWVYP